MSLDKNEKENEENLPEEENKEKSGEDTIFIELKCQDVSGALYVGPHGLPTKKILGFR